MPARRCFPGLSQPVHSPALSIGLDNSRSLGKISCYCGGRRQGGAYEAGNDGARRSDLLGRTKWVSMATPGNAHARVLHILIPRPAGAGRKHRVDRSENESLPNTQEPLKRGDAIRQKSGAASSGLSGQPFGGAAVESAYPQFVALRGSPAQGQQSRSNWRRLLPRIAEVEQVEGLGSSNIYFWDTLRLRPVFPPTKVALRAISVESVCHVDAPPRK